MKLKNSMLGIAVIALTAVLALPAAATGSGGCWYCGGVKERSATFSSNAGGGVVNEGQALAAGKKTLTLSTSVSTKDLGAGGSAVVPEKGDPKASAYSYADFQTSGLSMSLAVGTTSAAAASMETGEAVATGSAETAVDN
ncbi:MAG: hypothetical protein ACK4SL_00080 [Candidatus Paceibacteria bacterium]